MGNSYGTIVGNSKGSYEGNKQGIKDGIKDARIPEPAIIEIEEKLQAQSKIHVMEANLSLTNVMKKGEENNPKLAILYTQKAKVDYYIDLSSSCLALEYGKFLFQLLRDHPRDLIFFHHKSGSHSRIFHSSIATCFLQSFLILRYSLFLQLEVFAFVDFPFNHVVYLIT